MKRKTKIANEFERLTFMKMQGMNERSESELRKVLKYQKRLSK